MEQKIEMRIEGKQEHLDAVVEFLKFDKMQRSGNPDNIFTVFEKPEHENALMQGYTDLEFDADLDVFYADAKNKNCLAFKAYRKNVFKFAEFMSEKFITCRFKFSWFEKYQGDECLFVMVIEKSCVIYFQRGVSYVIAPNIGKFIEENNLGEYVSKHTRKENEEVE